MKRYIVIFGCRAWGKRSSTQGSRFAQSNLETTQHRPERLPLAPEDDEFAEEIRQLIVGRYRVLFTIRKGKVHVLHVRGAHK